jgi:acetyl esterase
VTRLLDIAAPDVCDVEDRTFAGAVGELPVRVYRPQHAGPDTPVLIWFHGGAWIIGDIEMYDATNRYLCNEAGCVVVCPQYRLAPEHVFPAAVDDCIASYEWILREADELGVDPSRVAVAGDSAGGTLSTIVCLHARDAGRNMPVFQGLIYPATDLATQRESHGVLLNKRVRDHFHSIYLAGADPRDPRVSPLFADSLAGLPPALLVTGGLDPLRDEGKAYAEALAAAGVAVDYESFEGMLHGFWGMGGMLAESRRLHQRLANTLRQAFAAAIEEAPASGVRASPEPVLDESAGSLVA